MSKDVHGSEPMKKDDGKVRVDLLPTYPLEQVSAVLTFGAKKYAAHRWRKGMEWSRLYGAVLRHVFAWFRGQDTDPETGLSHLAHAICGLMFLLEYSRTGAGTDDREGKLKDAADEAPFLEAGGVYKDRSGQNVVIVETPHEWLACKKKAEKKYGLEGLLWNDTHHFTSTGRYHDDGEFRGKYDLVEKLGKV